MTRQDLGSVGGGEGTARFGVCRGQPNGPFTCSCWLTISQFHSYSNNEEINEFNEWTSYKFLQDSNIPIFFFFEIKVTNSGILELNIRGHFTKLPLFYQRE